MVVYDSLVHTTGTTGFAIEDTIKRLDEAGVSRILLTSYHPDSFSLFNPEKPFDRMETVLRWAAAYPDRIIPFYWIDPLEEDAFEQVDRAVASGIRGFKVICNRHFPGDDRPMRVWERIAKANKPIMFHAGISYANGPTSQYTRPIAFEDLLYIPHLRFMLGHIAWPWCDECLSVLGKTRSGYSPSLTAEMFINTAPGTPDLYREDALNKAYQFGVDDSFVFGSDTGNDYNAAYVKKLLDMDNGILDKIGVTAKQKEKYFSRNLLRFIGE